MAWPSNGALVAENGYRVVTVSYFMFNKAGSGGGGNPPPTTGQLWPRGNPS